MVRDGAGCAGCLWCLLSCLGLNLGGISGREVGEVGCVLCVLSVGANCDGWVVCLGWGGERLLVGTNVFCVWSGPGLER